MQCFIVLFWQAYRDEGTWGWDFFPLPVIVAGWVVGANPIFVLVLPSELRRGVGGGGLRGYFSCIVLFLCSRGKTIGRFVHINGRILYAQQPHDRACINTYIQYTHYGWRWMVESRSTPRSALCVCERYLSQVFLHNVSNICYCSVDKMPRYQKCILVSMIPSDEWL